MDTSDKIPLSAAQLMVLLQEKTNLNAKELAELIQVSPSTVTRITKGQVCPSYDAMLVYVYRGGYSITGSGLERAESLCGYRSAKEIGDFINGELAQGLDAERLRVVLRVVPKLIYDWKHLPVEDLPKMLLPRPQVIQREWQALLEAAVRFFAHSELWTDAPRWTSVTHLEKPFVPRAAVREMGSLRLDYVIRRMAPEFAEKNILFSHREMQLL
ncbi:MAG: helix-turn-helix domain-containing protein [Coriobacteriales bacterium]|jgi:hypothetical protein|nr:helix-turn-helix domain-containing protein [Coriobacteriales bacterium]